MRQLRTGVCAAVGAAAIVVAVAVPAGAHRSGCHSQRSCPSDHHTYAWHGLICTSYAAERLASDTKTVVVSGRTYWCHRGPAEGPTGVEKDRIRRGVGGVACGVERWSVKTLTDPGARSIDFNARPTTVEALRRLRAPGRLGTQRIGPVEKTTYRLSARMVAFKQEADSDIHLVIADPQTGGTMIAEFPAAFCVGAGAPAPARVKMRAARAALLRCGAVSRLRFTRLNGTVTITGVGFFDFAHGQRGVAPNAIELHPVLAISGACT